MLDAFYFYDVLYLPSPYIRCFLFLQCFSIYLLLSLLSLVLCQSPPVRKKFEGTERSFYQNMFPQHQLQIHLHLLEYVSSE